MMNSSRTEPIFTRQLYPTPVVAPAPEFPSHSAGFFAQPRNKFGEERSYFVLADVLTLDVVGNRDESIFTISSFFPESERGL